MRRLIWVGLTISVVVFVTASFSAQIPEKGVKYVAVRAGRLIDGLGRPPITDAVILIKNGADVIKMIASGGVLSEEESVGEFFDPACRVSPE